MTGKDVLPEKDLLEKASTMKRFEYSPLGKEIKIQTDMAKKEYGKLTIFLSLIKTFKKEKPEVENYIKPNLIYSSKYIFIVRVS